MKTINPVDAARIELLLSDLRLPAIKLMWAKVHGTADGARIAAPPSSVMNWRRSR